MEERALTLTWLFFLSGLMEVEAEEMEQGEFERCVWVRGTTKGAHPLLLFCGLPLLVGLELLIE